MYIISIPTVNEFEADDQASTIKNHRWYRALDNRSAKDRRPSIPSFHQSSVIMSLHDKYTSICNPNSPADGYTAPSASLICPTIDCLACAVSANPSPRLFECISFPVSTIVTSKLPVTPRSIRSLTRIRSRNSLSRKSFSALEWRPYPHPPQYWIMMLVLRRAVMVSIRAGDFRRVQKKTQSR